MALADEATLAVASPLQQTTKLSYSHGGAMLDLMRKCPPAIATSVFLLSLSCNPSPIDFYCKIPCESAAHCPQLYVCGSCGLCGPGENPDRYCDVVNCNSPLTAPQEPGPCSGAAITFQESEPNDGLETSDFNSVPTSGTAVTISGSIACGNDGETYTGDSDWFMVEVSCNDIANFSLDWWSDSGSSDLDFYIYDSDLESVTWNAENNFSGPTTGSASLLGETFVQVLCWEGDTSSYSFEMRW